MSKLNTFMQNPIVREITFMQATNKDHWTQVDTKFVDDIKKYSWRVDKNGYYFASSVTLPDGTFRKNCGLHEFVLALGGEPLNEVTDHIKSDEHDINNTLANVRGATQRQNAFNKKVLKNSKSGKLGIQETPKGFIGNIWLNMPEGRGVGISKNCVAMQIAINILRSLYADEDVKDFLSISEFDIKDIDVPTIKETLRILTNYCANQAGSGRDGKILKVLLKQLK